MKKLICFLLLFLAGLITNVYASFIPLEYEVNYDKKNEVVNFNVVFSEPTNFYTVKPLVNTSAEANDFQFIIFKDKKDIVGNYPYSDIASIVTGNKIFESNGINVYAPTPVAVENAVAGSWILNLAEGIPYNSTVNSVDFNIPITYLGRDGKDKNEFSYELQTCEYGSEVFHGYGKSGSKYYAVPEPATMSLLGMGFLGLLFKKKQR